MDIGGVIIAKANDRDDTSFFSEHFLRTPPVDGAIDTIRRLAQLRFAGRVHLVSKAGPTTEAKARDWLATHRFHETTGVPPANLHFCRERAQKVGICRRLRVTHFVDDRLEVLGFLAATPHRYLFQADPDEVRRFAQHLDGVEQVRSWSDLVKALI